MVIQNRLTYIEVNDLPGAGGACHNYTIYGKEEGRPHPVLGNVIFQNGPIKENGVNGLQNEDLMLICIHRLQGFQSGDFKCRENAIALTKLEEALMWLQKRTKDRETRGVEGTHKV